MKLSEFESNVLAQLEKEDPEEAKAYLEALEEEDSALWDVVFVGDDDRS